MEKAKNDIITYQWEGVNKAGEKVNGVIDARSLAIAKADLRKQGIITKKVVKKRKPFFDKKIKKLPRAILPFSAAS